jgi:hypothetical protein
MIICPLGPIGQTDLKNSVYMGTMGRDALENQLKSLDTIVRDSLKNQFSHYTLVRDSLKKISFKSLYTAERFT